MIRSEYQILLDSVCIFAYYLFISVANFSLLSMFVMVLWLKLFLFHFYYFKIHYIVIFTSSNFNKFELFSGIDSIHTNTMLSLLNTHILKKNTSIDNIIVIIICTQNRIREASKWAEEEKKMRIVECVYVPVCLSMCANSLINYLMHFAFVLIRKCYSLFLSHEHISYSKSLVHSITHSR